jgi:flagellar basal-body rod protein FlgF
MDNAGYTTLTRQSGLMREMQVVANNIANMATGGYRKEGIVFSEYVNRLPAERAGHFESLSMATARVGVESQLQGALTQTNGTFDFAVEGEGYFLIETPEGGQALTRAGNFTPSAEGELVTADGYRVLDGGGTPIFVPANARSISVASDGTLSADDVPLAQIGLWRAAAPEDVTRRSGVLFDLSAPPVEVPDGAILQGFLEGSNVDAVTEIARMIEVQRAYELGQTFLEKED